MAHMKALLYEQTKGDHFREGAERRILNTGTLMTVVIDFDNGPWAKADPMHSHPQEQITYVAEGELLFLAEGEEPYRLLAGDMVAIPPDLPHSIQLLSR